MGGDGCAGKPGRAGRRKSASPAINPLGIRPIPPKFGAVKSDLLRVLARCGLLALVVLVPSCATSRGVAGGSSRAGHPARPADADHPVRIACIGDSITYGLGIPDRETKNFPAQLGAMLGDGFDVRGFAVSGATAQRGGRLAMADLPAFRAAEQFRPEIVVLCLGTNDSKKIHWVSRSHFAAEYGALIDAIQGWPGSPKVFAACPIPVFGDSHGISARTLQDGVIPGIRTAARQRHVPVIDLNTPLQGHDEWTSDKIHPTSEGSAAIAREVKRGLHL